MRRPIGFVLVSFAFAFGAVRASAARATGADGAPEARNIECSGAAADVARECAPFRLASLEQRMASRLSELAALRDLAGQAHLHRVQVAWERYRDARCAERAAVVQRATPSDHGAVGFARTRCLEQLTYARLRELSAS